MAFWALGKVKNLSEKLNLKEYKDYGSKILHNYMVNKQSQQSQFFDFTQQKPTTTTKTNININRISTDHSNNKQSKRLKQTFTDQEWLQIQLSQYKKLSQMQSRLLAQHQESQKKRLAQQYQELQRQLEEVQKQQNQQLESIQKQKLKNELRQGKKTLQSLIRQNVLLREQIEKKKI